MNSKHSFFGDSNFRNMLEVSSQPDDIGFSYHNSQLKPSDEPTRISKLPSVLDFLRSSTLQEGPRHYQISFEDNFMEEHEKALQKQIENFMESSFKNGGNEKITFESSEMFNQELEFGSFKSEDDISINFQNKSSFLKEIQKQEKLQEFFQHVFSTIPKKVAEEILYVSSIAFYSWEKNLRNNFQFSNELQVVGQSKKLTQEKFQQLYEDQAISFLNLKKVSMEELNSQKVLEKSFKELIESIFATTALIFLGFFTNPYMESDETKRARSFRLQDDEDQLSSSSTYNQLGTPKKRFH